MFLSENLSVITIIRLRFLCFLLFNSKSLSEKRNRQVDALRGVNEICPFSAFSRPLRFKSVSDFHVDLRE
jgi:hypothetical protein